MYASCGQVGLTIDTKSKRFPMFQSLFLLLNTQSVSPSVFSVSISTAARDDHLADQSPPQQQQQQQQQQQTLSPDKQMLNFQPVPSRVWASCGVDAAAAVDNVVAVGL